MRAIKLTSKRVARPSVNVSRKWGSGHRHPVTAVSPCKRQFLPGSAGSARPVTVNPPGQVDDLKQTFAYT